MTLPTPDLRRVALATFALFTLIAALALPIGDLFLPGRMLHWHTGRPTFVEGGIEALSLLAAMLGVAAVVRARTISFALILAISLLYLRRHHVDVPALVAVLYFEAMLALGVLVVRRFSTDEATTRQPRVFLAGLVALALILLAASVAGFGRPRDLSIVALVVIPLALLLARTTPLTGHVARDIHALDRGPRLIAVALFTLLVVLFARTNHLIGFDPLWYGFRPEQVLAPDRSLFDATGLVSPVYYFPKLYELVLMPLSATRDFSFALSFGVCVLALLGLYTYRFARDVGTGRMLAASLAAMAVTVPAIANTALSPKPDVIAGLLLLVSACFFHRGVQARSWPDAVLGIAAAGLSIQGKLVAIPFAGMLAIGATVAWWITRRASSETRGDGSTVAPRATAASMVPMATPSLATFVMLGTLAITAALMFRTYLLTGVPTIGPDALMSLWNALGFTLKDPVGSLEWTQRADPSDIPQLVVDLLAFPSRLEHVVISWVGNAWLWLTIVAGVAAVAWRDVIDRRPRAETIAWCLLVPVLAMGVYLQLGVSYHYRGSDGNYFIAPLAIGLAFVGPFAARALAPSRLLTGIACAGLLASSMFHAYFSFANAAWGTPGTRTLDADFSRSFFDSRYAMRDLVDSKDLGTLEEWLRRADEAPMILGYVPGDAAGFALSARYESLAQVGFSRPGDFTDEDAFGNLMAQTNADLLLLPSVMDDGIYRPVVYRWAERAVKRGDATVENVGPYFLVDVSGWTRRNPRP